MRAGVLFAIPLLLPVLSAAGVPADPAEEIFTHVRALSSPLFEGREAGTDGARRSADYVASRFEEAGLLPAGDGGSWFHRFPLAEGGDTVWCRNVAGAVDPDREGAVLLIGAHHDHLGLKDGVLYPGADDDASGVAVLIETARLFARENDWNGPVLFVSFSAEEKGALGSKAWLRRDDSLVKRTAGMINMDMVGRLEEKPLLFALEGFPEESVESFVSAAGDRLPLVRLRTGYEAGDMGTFTAAGIPSLFLFTGPHADYHRPTDTAEKIDRKGLLRIRVFLREAASLFGQLAIESEGFSGEAPPPIRRNSAGPEPPRAFLGTVPDFTAPPGEGAAVADIVPGSPAEKAGLRAGDRIIRLGGAPTADLRAYAEALRALRPGEEVIVEVLRGGESLALPVVLGIKNVDGGHPGGRGR